MSRYLDSLAAFIREHQLSVYRIAVMEKDTPPEAAVITPANVCQNSYSVAKLFTATAIGMLCDEGRLSTEDRIASILSEEFAVARGIGSIDDRWLHTTVDWALTQRLGLPGGFLDIDAGDVRTFGKDYLSYLLTYPLQTDPGTAYSYTDGAYYLLSRVVSKITGQNLTEYLWERLFSPLDFHEVAWSSCPLGYAMGATGLYIDAADMVKLGHVYINGGQYNGKRIISADWIQQAKERRYELNPIGEGPWWGKGGMLGQMLCMNFNNRRSVAWHGYNTESDKITAWIKEHDEAF